MKYYHIYFFFLKTIVFAQVVFRLLGFEVANSPLFAIVDMIFKISLGLFMGIYFWLFTPKGIDWEDGFILSLGGFIILSDINFTPVVQFYELRDKTLAAFISLKNRM